VELLGGAGAQRAEQLVVIADHRAAVRAAVRGVPLHPLGIAMQASSQNQLAAYYMGIPVKRLNGLVWGLAAAVAALAGLLLAPITFVHVNMGFIGLKAFPAAVVGGFGSLPGAIVGGLIIGVVESLAGFYLPDRASRTSRLHVRRAGDALVQAERTVRREAAQEGLGRCASCSRPRTSRTSRSPSTAATGSGTGCSWPRCSPRPGRFGVLARAAVFVLIYSIVGLGLMLLAGYTGQVSIGHAAFLGGRRVRAGRAHRAWAGRSR
jgi:ABC-type branched-subunit amino acid transport system permease subunit